MTPPPFHISIFIKQPTSLKEKSMPSRGHTCNKENLKKGEPNTIARTYLQREQQKDHYHNFNILWK
jgi:hypothetical protein